MERQFSLKTGGRLFLCNKTVTVAYSAGLGWDWVWLKLAADHHSISEWAPYTKQSPIVVTIALADVINLPLILDYTFIYGEEVSRELITCIKAGGFSLQSLQRCDIMRVISELAGISQSVLPTPPASPNPALPTLKNERWQHMVTLLTAMCPSDILPVPMFAIMSIPEILRRYRNLGPYL
jgi:hypothetical protein